MIIAEMDDLDECDCGEPSVHVVTTETGADVAFCADCLEELQWGDDDEL